MNKANYHILVIDDEKSIRDMLCLTLKREGYSVDDCESSAKATKSMENQVPSLILLDWMLPNESGIEFAAKLKSQTKTENIPIIMITAKTEEEDKLAGFRVGSDDYITKPFSIREMLARIESVLKRSYPNNNNPQKITINNLSIDKDTHLIQNDQGEIIHVGPTEFKLLYFLATHPNKVYSRNQLLDHVWGKNIYIEDRTVDVHIRRLRKALEPYDLAHTIRTVRGSGYSLIP